jgi:predicted transcriptional regulator
MSRFSSFDVPRISCFLMSGCIMKRRNRIDIIADMLSACLEGEKKTHIMNRCNLNSKLVNLYLKTIIHAGLLTFDAGNNTYSVTQKGKSFLDGFKDYKIHLNHAVDRMKTVRNKRNQLQELCLPIKDSNEEHLSL